MKKKHSFMDRKGALLLIVLCASWGINQVAIKAIVGAVSPVLQAGIRSIGASLLVLAWMKIRGIRVLEKDGSLWWGLVCGLLFSAEFILIYWGLTYTSASRSVIFLYTSPFVVALGAQLFIPGESLTRIQVIGLCLAFLGILTAFNESMGLPTARMAIGDAMLLGAALFWGGTTVMIKASPLAKIPPAKTLLYQLGGSALIMPVTSVALGEPGLIKFTVLVAASLLYQIVWIAFITYVAWFWLISTYPVSRLAPFTFLTPLFGVLAGALLLNEPLTLSLIVALALVGSGIFLVNRP